MADGDRLPGGWMSGARLVGGNVRRPLHANIGFVHRLLRHLQEVGFPGAPRVVGIEDGEEVLTYVHGHVPVEVEPEQVSPVVFSDAGIESAFALIRRYHDATVGTSLCGAAEVVCHRDLSPWNTVYDPQGAIAFIDWDAASPGTASEDVGYALWRHLRLGFPNAPPFEVQHRQLRIAAAAYGRWEVAELVPFITAAQEAHLQHFVARQAERDQRYLRLIELGALDYIRNAHRWTTERSHDLTE